MVEIDYEKLIKDVKSRFGGIHPGLHMMKLFVKNRIKKPMNDREISSAIKIMCDLDKDIAKLAGYLIWY
jgi:hypothetical protein